MIPPRQFIGRNRSKGFNMRKFIRALVGASVGVFNGVLNGVFNGVLIGALIGVLALAGATPALANPQAYDEAADARQELAQALQSARAAKLPLLVVFGANWCGDCKVLDMAMKSGASAPLIQQHFKVVKVNVGRFDRNVDLAEGLGVPLKMGIPAVAVLSPEGKPLYATRQGELADARSMGEQGIHDFFTKVARSAK